MARAPGTEIICHLNILITLPATKRWLFLSLRGKEPG
jgi:hypothetical protein